MIRSQLLKIILVLVLPLILVGPLRAQEDNDGEIPSLSGRFYFGLNAGGYLANKYTAPYYAGYNGFTIPDLLAIPQIYSQVFTLLQTNFTMGEYPANPRYRTGVNIGLNAGYYLDESTALYTNIDVVRLKVQEVFTLEAENPANPSGDPIIYPQAILGEENRLNIDLGLHIDYGDPGKAGGYLELFGNLNAVRARRNEVLIENSLRYSLLMQPNVYNRTDLGGIGFGFGLGSGIRIPFNEKYTFDIGASASMQKIALWEDRKFRLNPLIYVRILWL